MQGFIAQSTYSFPVLMQAGTLQNPPPAGYGLTYDNYVVVDADGIVRYTSQNRPRHPTTGRFYDAELRAAIQQWLPPPTSVNEGGDPAFYLHVRAASAAAVSVEFGLPARSAVRIVAFDVTGRAVGTIADGPFASGPHSLRWDRTGRGGRRTAAGLYLVHLRAGSLVTTRKVVLLD